MISEGLGVAFAPAPVNRWVAQGAGGTAFSANGADWALSATQPFSFLGRGVAFSEELGLFLAGGNGGNAYATSPDGSTWTTYTVPMTTVYAVAVGLGAAEDPVMPME